MPLFDYCDVVWSPSTAKLNCLIERIHSKFINKLIVPFTLTECRRFNTANPYSNFQVNFQRT